MMNRLSPSVSITAKMLILTLLIGGTVCFFLDIVQERHLRGIYLSDLEEQFDHRTTEDSLSFDSYIKRLRLAVEFSSQHSAMVDFLAKGFPAPQAPPVKHSNSAPAWFPDQQHQKLFSPVQLAFLLDSKNQVREFYMRREADIPEELLKPSSFLIKTSQGQSLLTTFAGAPYIVTSKKILSKQGTLLATLIFASLIDDNFLNLSRGNFIHKHVMSLVLSKNEKQTILTSTNLLALPPGTSIDNLRKNYLIISREIFDHVASDLKIRTVFFMPVREVENQINESLSTSRQQRLILAFSILLASFLTTLLVSRRIRRLTRDFIEFEQRELGLKEATQLKGDEVAILNSRFKALTLEVVTSREIIRNEARQLAKIAENKVKIQNQILDQINDAIISTDIHHQITSWNSGAERLFGYSQDEAVGQPISTFFSESEYQELSARIDADKATNQTYELEVTLMKKSGELFFGHLSLSQLRNESGAITGFISYTKDITRQKLSESAMQVSKQRFQALTESINDWIWEMNQDGIYTYASPRIYDLLGYFPEEIIGTTPFDHMPEDEAKKIGEIFSKIAHEQKPFRNLQNINIHKNGALVVIETSGAPIFDESGSFIGYRGVDRDVTEQNKARVALQNSRELLNTAQEIGHIGSWEWDISTGELAWSDEAFRIFGIKPQRSRPSFDSFIAAVHPEDRKAVENAIRTALDGKAPYNIEHRIVLPDTTQRIVGEKAIIERAEDGSPLRMIGSVQDITEMKEIENNLQKYQDHLEELVAERTIELQKAKEESDRANQAKSLFLASMSHELRTPMNVIIGFSQLLETDDREPLSNRQTNHLQKIIRSGEHLLLLINNVLDLAKIESGSLQDIFIEPVNVCSICHESVELVQSMADSLNIEILPCELEKAIFIEADRTLFRQIFLNLLSNAIKYNKPGGNVAFSCEVLEGRIRLIVADTGIGIAKEKIGLLFEPFNRLGAETSSVEGTGIGLTITKRLIELMHASIDVESEVGKGTKFFIDFPMAEPPANEAKTFHPQRKTTGYDLEKDHTLLYVEDDRLNLELMEEILGLKPNLKLLTAEDAESGIDLAIKHKPDIILMDLNLPDLDGFEAFQRLKELPETKNIPVVAISGDTMSANIQKATLAGFAEYLTKPYNIDILYQVINDILSQKPNKILFPVE